MNFIRTWTLTKKEIHRFLKVWVQTLASPVVVALLYFAVFGGALSSQIDGFFGIPYMAFVVPGLALLQSTSNAFQNASSSLIIAKYHGTIAEIMMAPLSPLEKTVGYFLGGLFRGMLVALVVIAVSFLFVPDLCPQHFWWAIFALFLTNGIFSILGTLVGIWGKTFDQMSFMTNFVITPMAFLGGVFYSVQALPPLAQTLTLFNPFFYCVDLLRWAFFGVADISPVISATVLLLLFVVCFILNLLAFAKDWRLKN